MVQWPHSKKVLDMINGLTKGAFLCKVCMFPLHMCGISLGTLVSYHSPKT